jgi:glycerophosphoryl diester phosphodiesterase
MRTRILALAVLGTTLAAAAPAAAATNPWLDRRPLNIAHQGGEDEFPSNTMYAFRQSIKAGADMLELDVLTTRDGKVVVNHDTSVDRTTNGKGLVSRKTLRQLRRLDFAYWFAPSTENAYRHDRKARSYRFRGVATGKRSAPKGTRRSDFRVVTLEQVLRAFPKTPINIEIKGRTKAEELDEYIKNAESLAKVLKGTKRKDLIVTSFKQQAVDRFHELVPKVMVAPGIDGTASFLLGGGSPGENVAAFQVPITYEVGGNTLQVTTDENVKKAHDAGYAWHVWLSNDGESTAIWKRVFDTCADGIMTAQPKALQRFMKTYKAPARCG